MIHSRQRRQIVSITIAAMVLGLLAVAPVAAASRSHAVAAGSNCVTVIASLAPGETTSKVISENCAATFAESIAAATGGAIRLPKGATPRDLASGPLGTLSQTVLSVDYQHEKENTTQTGWTKTWFSNDSHGCTGGYAYAVSTLVGTMYNNSISSSHAWGGCRAFHYEDPSYGGSVRVCTCWTMGVMNDQTSSLSWEP